MKYRIRDGSIIEFVIIAMGMMALYGVMTLL